MTKRDKDEVKGLMRDVMSEYHTEVAVLEFEKLTNKIDNVEKRLEGVEGRLTGVEEGLSQVKDNLGDVETRLGYVEKKLDYTIEEFNSQQERQDKRIDKIEAIALAG